MAPLVRTGGSRHTGLAALPHRNIHIIKGDEYIIMVEYGYTKKDWALFREKIADWQEAYMDKLNKEYIDLLNGDGRPSEKFWALEERIRNDKKDTGVQLRMSRSNCIYNIVSLLNEGAITMEDLEEFSDELKERVHFIAK